MKQYNKKTETKEEYIVNRKKRILQLLALTEVSEDDYIEALSWSRAGYSVHLKRDRISIMKQYNKKTETKEEFIVNRKKRILQLLALPEVSEDDYIEALSWSRAGYSVHLKRNLNEIYINSYNPEWIRAWDGNIDIKPVFDFFEVITYIIEYFAKN